MATIYLDPTADGTANSWTGSTGAMWSACDDYDNGGADDGVHDSDTTRLNGPNKTNASCFMEIQDTPADFDPANITAIRIKWTVRKVTGGIAGGGDLIDAAVAVYKADEATALTDEQERVNLDSSYSGNEFTETMTPQGSPSKADWDGARVRVRQTYTAVDAADTNCWAGVTAIRVEIDYTAAPPPPAPETLRVVTSGRRWV